MNILKYLKLPFVYRKIPVGPYCYIITSIDYANAKVNTRMCSFYTPAKCLWTNTLAESSLLFDDQCKVCGFKDNHKKDHKYKSECK
jgi:hypothetical protein